MKKNVIVCKYEHWCCQLDLPLLLFFFYFNSFCLLFTHFLHFSVILFRLEGNRRMGIYYCKFLVPSSVGLSQEWEGTLEATRETRRPEVAYDLPTSTTTKLAQTLGRTAPFSQSNSWSPSVSFQCSTNPGNILSAIKLFLLRSKAHHAGNSDPLSLLFSSAHHPPSRPVIALQRTSHKWDKAKELPRQAKRSAGASLGASQVFLRSTSDADDLSNNMEAAAVFQDTF